MKLYKEFITTRDDFGFIPATKTMDKWIEAHNLESYSIASYTNKGRNILLAYIPK